MMGKKIGMIVGVVLILVAITGFVGGLGITGPEGFFVTNTVHDLIHLVTGIVLVWVAAKSPSAMGMTFKVFGIVYLIVAVLGFAMGDTILGFVHANMADHVLHVILAVVFLWAGFMGSKSGMMSGGGMS